MSHDWAKERLEGDGSTNALFLLYYGGRWSGHRDVNVM